MKMAEKSKINNERLARHKMIEELFYDFNRNRQQIYWMNFVRGLFFGFGTILGGTVLVAIIVWVLSQFAGWIPPLSDFINQFIDIVQRAK